MRKPQRSIRITLGVALAATALVLASCAGGAGDGSSSGDDAAADNTLVVGSGVGIPQLNPAIRTFSDEEILFPLLWSGLTRWDQAGTVQSELATSWEASDDATQWTFDLDPDAVFSDGSAITAQDVKDTFEYYLHPDTATQERNKIASVESVAATGDNQVTFQLSSPNALFPESIVYVKIMKMSAIDTINDDPITSGPWEVASFSPDNSVTLVPNEEYWGDKPALAKIELVKAADPTAASTSLRSGDLQVLSKVALADVKPLQAESNISLVSPETPSQAITWELDVSSAPFDDVTVRQALAYAIDRETVLSAAYFGQGSVSTTNTMLADDNPVHADDLIDYSYDLKKAKELFDKAGITEGTTFTWWSSSTRPEWQTSAQILQASLAEIGITLEIVVNDSTTWANEFYPAGKSFPNMIVPNMQSVPSEPAFSMNFLLAGRCECNWNSTAFDDVFAQAVGTLDADERNELWAEAQRLENEQVPLLTPLQQAPTSATASDVKGLWLEGGGQVHLESVSISR